jgi:uncharacterized protein YjbI with pentapeptide repeats
MIHFPNLLTSSVSDFVSWSKELSTTHKNKAEIIRSAILESTISNSHQFQDLSSTKLIEFTAVCLSYSELNEAILNNPDFKKVILSNISAILKSLDMQQNKITPMNSISSKIQKILEE